MCRPAYARSLKTLKERTIEYCYLLDQLAIRFDATVMQSSRHQTMKYLAATSGVARTMAVLTIIQQVTPKKILRPLKLGSA